MPDPSGLDGCPLKSPKASRTQPSPTTAVPGPIARLLIQRSPCGVAGTRWTCPVGLTKVTVACDASPVSSQGLKLLDVVRHQGRVLIGSERAAHVTDGPVGPPRSGKRAARR